MKVWGDLILARVHPYRYSFGKMQTCVKFSEKNLGWTHTHRTLNLELPLSLWGSQNEGRSLPLQ